MSPRSDNTSYDAADDAVPFLAATAVVAVSSSDNNSAAVPTANRRLLETTERPEVDQAALRLAGGMTWTDNYFDGRDDDIVAVFDHDIATLEELEEQSKIDAEFSTCSSLYLMLYTISALGFLYSLAILDTTVPIMVPLSLATFFLAICCLTRPAERRWRRHTRLLQRKEEEEEERGLRDSHSGADHARRARWPHTAVTRTGVRHVVSARPERPGNRAYVLDIPLADILSIDIKPMYSTPVSTSTDTMTTSVHYAVHYDVILTLAATDDGIEYMTSGYCHFQKTSATGQIRVILQALIQPVWFKKLVVALQLKNVVHHNRSTSSSLARL